MIIENAATEQFLLEVKYILRSQVFIWFDRVTDLHCQNIVKTIF